MRKLLTFFMALAVLATCLIGCTNGPDDSQIILNSDEESNMEEITIHRPEPAEVYNVKDFGATGDGEQWASPYIQEAADMCKEQNGGTIVIPAGKYVCSSIRLYSNTTLILEEGCEIYASSDESHYEKVRGAYDTGRAFRDAELLAGRKAEDMNPVELSYLQGQRAGTDNVFYAREANNITITGKGVINGHWQDFFNMDYENGYLNESDQPRYCWRTKDGIIYDHKIFRPVMIGMLNCSNITITDITIIDAPYYNIQPVLATNITIDNVTINTSTQTTNTDGINLYGCKNGVITNCYIKNGDDSIALSGETNGVIIDNCTANTNSCLLRVFVGIDAFFTGASESQAAVERLKVGQNVKVTNCHLEDGGAFMIAMAAYGTVRDITIENCSGEQTLNGTGMFLCIQGGGYLDNIKIDGFDWKGNGAMTVMGESPEHMTNVTVTNSTFDISPRSKLFGNGLKDPVTFYVIQQYCPYNFYVRHAQNLTVTGCRFLWGEDDLDDMMDMKNPLNRTTSANIGWTKDLDPNPNFPALDIADVDHLVLSDNVATAHGDCEAIRTNNIR